MKKVKQENPNGGNMLNELYVFMVDLPIRFRETTCAECNWSLPTFYRKMRGVDKPSEHDKNKIIPALSNAEKEGILRKACLVLEDLKVCLAKYK